MTAPLSRRHAALRRVAQTCLVLAAFACASAPVSHLRPGASRVVVAPLNLGLRTPDELQGSEAPVWNELVSYLHAQDERVRIVDAVDAAELWQEALADLEHSGSALEPRAAAARFAARLREHADYDVLVMPSLVLRRARVGGKRVSWDGTRRSLPVRARVPADLAVGFGAAGSGYTGTVAAASLYVALLGPDGRTIFEGLAGLDVIQELVKGKRSWSESPWRLETRSDPFTDAAGLRAGIGRAFERPLPATARTW
jgi:hypothetical protein